jgi:adenosylcobinamide-phosphate synthase
VKLGGDTRYFGVLKKKPFFGEGREKISKKDIQKALTLQPRLDIMIVVLLGVLSL